MCTVSNFVQYDNVLYMSVKHCGIINVLLDRHPQYWVIIDTIKYFKQGKQESPDRELCHQVEYFNTKMNAK